MHESVTLGRLFLCWRATKASVGLGASTCGQFAQRPQDRGLPEQGGGAGSDVSLAAAKTESCLASLRELHFGQLTRSRRERMRIS